MSKTKRQFITQSEYLQLLGLKTLADANSKMNMQIIDAIRGITKEENECGHSSDVVWDIDTSIDDLLKNLNLSVEQKEAKL